MDTARTAFAPSLSLRSVPSKSRSAWSIATWSNASWPISAGAMIAVACSMAFRTPLPA
jgi:hypothetical protein